MDTLDYLVYQAWKVSRVLGLMIPQPDPPARELGALLEFGRSRVQPRSGISSLPTQSNNFGQLRLFRSFWLIPSTAPTAAPTQLSFLYTL